MKTGFLVGRKRGMLRLFSDDGSSSAVTVVDVSDNRVESVKGVSSDGYSAVRVCFGKIRPNKLSRPVLGVYAKASVEPGLLLKEFKIPSEEVASYVSGDTLGVDMFEVGSLLKVSGVTRGHGFSGCIKRHHFASGPKSHGNSLSHNKPGSTGMCQDPGRVFPGKKLPGHMGFVKRTVRNLRLVGVDSERFLLLIKGAIPGPKGGVVFIQSTV